MPMLLSTMTLSHPQRTILLSTLSLLIVCGCLLIMDATGMISYTPPVDLVHGETPAPSSSSNEPPSSHENPNITNNTAVDNGDEYHMILSVMVMWLFLRSGYECLLIYLRERQQHHLLQNGGHGRSQSQSRRRSAAQLRAAKEARRRQLEDHLVKQQQLTEAEESDEEQGGELSSSRTIYMSQSCPICLDVFPTSNKTEETPLLMSLDKMEGNDGKPLLALACGHIFDTTCLVEWILSQDDKDGIICACPVCLHPIDLPPPPPPPPLNNVRSNTASPSIPTRGSWLRVV